MSPPNPNRKHDAERRRALELLADSPDGCTEHAFTAHGFTLEMLVELITAGLASTRLERVRMSWRDIEMKRVRITLEGLRALGENYG